MLLTAYAFFIMIQKGWDFMAKYDFQNDFQNDTARANYEASMTGRRRKGLDLFEKPHLWEEERPCDIKDSPRENFVPIPTIGTGDCFAGYSLGRKIAVIAGISVVALFVAVCAVGFFMDGGLTDGGRVPFLFR